MLEIKWLSPLEISSLVTAQAVWDLEREVEVSRRCFCASLYHLHHYRGKQSHCEGILAIPTFAHLFSSGDFLEAITGTFPFKIKYQTIVSQKRTSTQPCRFRVQIKISDAHRYMQYMHILQKLGFKIQFHNLVKLWRGLTLVFLMPQDSSTATQILNPPSDRRCHVPICIQFWSLPDFSYISEFQALAESLRE